MKVMITGATTPLGLGLVDRLFANPAIELVLAVGGDVISAHRDPRFRFHALDLAHPRAMHDLLWGEARALAIDTVVHAMQHRSADERGADVHAQNVESTRALVLGCAHHASIRHLVVRSFSEVYALPHATPDLLDEDAALEFGAGLPQWVRDRVEADLVACTADHAPLAVTVLRCAEILAPDMGSQLWDYLRSRVCLRPAGFDPIVNVLSLADAIEAFAAAVEHPVAGVFNIVGRDSLPLSRAIACAGRIAVPVPSALLSPLYRLRRRIAGFEFHYDLNAKRFHFGGVLDGTRARDQLGYEPHTAVSWS
ncbi:MAG TPA: NAD-dependent epimerase/dehydratase family protein [Kofleriaceae bacterium]|nr:NAD-dependent epimerase/dehydratase family protein [Kofleriaceae bacterium]